MAQIMASLDDINNYLPEDQNVVKADDVNSVEAQVSASRLIRGYLSRVIDNTTLVSWSSPDATPDIIREVAGLLIASQLFFDAAAAASLDIDVRHVSQLLYDRAIAILQQIVTGQIIVPGIIQTNPEVMSELDFFPRDDTDRAFSMNMTL